MVAWTGEGQRREGHVLEAQPTGVEGKREQGKGGILGLQPEQRWTVGRKVVVTAQAVPSEAPGRRERGPGVPQASRCSGTPGLHMQGLRFPTADPVRLQCII